jgi:hypothetical protein
MIFLKKKRAVAGSGKTQAHSLNNCSAREAECRKCQNN